MGARKQKPLLSFVADTCPQCGKEFVKRVSWQRYCENACLKTFYKKKQREYCRAYRKRHPDRVKVNREKNKEYHRIYAKKWSDAHREQRRESMKRYRERHPDRLKEIMRRSSFKNRFKRRERSRLWRLNNPEKRRDYERRRRLTDKKFLLEGRLRAGLRTLLRRYDSKKSARFIELIGCSVEHLVHHIQRQFLPGMTWENREKWHIDHIRPCASFDLTQPEQQRECFYYLNLRPLWGRKNQQKKDSWNGQVGLPFHATQN